MSEATAHFDPPGLRFFDKASNREMKYIYPDAPQWSGWIVYKHPDGQWVSLREATDDDLRVIDKAEGERILASAHQYIRASYHGSNFYGPVVKLIVPWETYSETLSILEAASRRNGGTLGGNCR